MFPRTNEKLSQARANGNWRDAFAKPTYRGTPGRSGFLNYGADATHPCKHKVTKRPICAVPCDGILELCDNDTDEQCEGIHIVIVLGLTFISALIFIALMSLITYYFAPKSIYSDREIISHDPILLKLSNYKIMWEVEDAIEVAKSHYGQIAVEANIPLVDEYFMETMGTNEMTAFLFDCVSEAFVVKVTKFFSRAFPCLFTMIRRRLFHRCCIIGEHVFYLVVRYFDLAKDMLLVFIVWLQLGNFDTGSFPSITFCVLVASILSSEAFNLSLVVQGDLLEISSKKKYLFVFIMPLLPAFFIYKCLLKRLQELDLTYLMRSIEVQMHQEKKRQVSQTMDGCMMTIRRLNLHSASLQCTENIIENIPQLSIVMLVTLLSLSNTRTVANIDRLFVNDNQYLGYIFMLATMASMIRGNLSYLKAHKNGCQMGFLTLITYFFTGVLSR